MRLGLAGVHQRRPAIENGLVNQRQALGVIGRLDLVGLLLEKPGQDDPAARLETGRDLRRGPPRCEFELGAAVKRGLSSRNSCSGRAYARSRWTSAPQRGLA